MSASHATRVQAFARRLFIQSTIRFGIVDWNDDRDVWVDLLNMSTPFDEQQRKKLVNAGRHFAARCLVVAEAALESFDAHEPARPEPPRIGLRMPEAAMREALAERARENPPRYACPSCGSHEVELCFPVWVRANELDNRELWDLDAEASPEKDSEKGWCIECKEHVLVRVLRPGGGT